MPKTARDSFGMKSTVHFLLALSSMLLLFGANGTIAGQRPTRGGVIKPDVLYHNYCSVCHGDRGDGRSRAQGSLNPPPRDFTSAGELTREAMVTIVTHGKPGTAMVGWKTQLSAEEIESVVDYIRKTFMILALDPRLQKGRTLYVHNCSVCHGERGQGSTLPVGGPLPPRNLASPQARAELSRDRMIQSVSQGRPGTGMAGFSGRLSAADIEAVVDYVRAALMVPETSISGTQAHGGRKSDPVPAPARADMSLPMPNGLKGDPVKGGRFYQSNCATCHGSKGDGKGPRAYFINPKPRNFKDAAAQAGFNRPVIFAATSAGRIGTEMPAWNKVLSDQEIADVAEYVFRNFIRTGSKDVARQ